jgi:hypothetical protein
VLALVGVALLAGALIVPPRAAAGAAIVFSEDFESGTLDPRFAASDSDVASGLDHWGVSDFRANGGVYSLWAAQVGTQSEGSFVGMNNSDPGVQLYDNDMQADVVVDLRVDGFDTLTLSFYYFIRTESGGGDWIQAWYEAGGVQTNIFDPRGSSGNAWDGVILSVPNDIERLIIRFHTDAANHGFEGAYVDDIVLTGTENVPPTSAVSALPAYSNDDPLTLPYVAVDNANASGVDHVELWVRFGGVGPWTLYTPPTHPLGRWLSSPIVFEASLADGDGYYEFYTVAVDRAGNPEAAAGSADASVTIDTVDPNVALSSPPPGAALESDEVAIEWSGTDDRSGIDRYEVSLDGFGFLSAGTNTSRTYTGLAAGEHTVVVRAVDRAGNVAEVAVTFTTLGPAAGFPWWIVAVIVGIVAAGLLLFLVWRRRDEEKQGVRGPPPSPAAPDPAREVPATPDGTQTGGGDGRQDGPS